MSNLSIATIAQTLNSKAALHDIGSLQSIRKRIKGLKHAPGQQIFDSRTIDANDNWAFHLGGRTELQFNIGRDPGEGDFRHGVAFSLETSQALPAIDPLLPKIDRFNEYVRLNPDEFADMRMWHFDSTGQRHKAHMPSSVPPEIVKVGHFIFLGKTAPIATLNYESILNDLDRLLPLYQYVESVEGTDPFAKSTATIFSFAPGCAAKPNSTSAKQAAKVLDVSLRHNDMQSALHKRLVGEFGAENVGTERPSGLGTRIDLVLRQPNGFWFYEIKTARSPRACIREALAQLLEYSFWPGATEALRLVIVGGSPLDADGAEYLDRLRSRFALPIEYECVEAD